MVKLPSDSRKDIDITTIHATVGMTMYDKLHADKYRLQVAENFERSDLAFCAAIKQATGAVAFHELLRKKFNESNKPSDMSLRIRLLRHMAENKPYAIQEREELKENNE